MTSMFGIGIIIAVIAASMGFAIYSYTQTQPNFKTVDAGEAVQVGPVQYIINPIGLHNGNEDKTPEGSFFGIRIIAENKSTETTRMHGGQFYLLDESDKKYKAVYGKFSEEDLFDDQLEPNEPVTWTTQFDIPYDEEMTYRVGILPTKKQSSPEIGIVCVQNC